MGLEALYGVDAQDCFEIAGEPARLERRSSARCARVRQNGEAMPAVAQALECRRGIRERVEAFCARERSLDAPGVERAPRDLELDRAADVLGELLVVAEDRLDHRGLDGRAKDLDPELGRAPRLADPGGVGERAVEVEDDDHARISDLTRWQYVVREPNSRRRRFRD